MSILFIGLFCYYEKYWYVMCEKEKLNLCIKFDELFPLNHNVLGWIIFNEGNQRNMRKFDELLPPIYFVLGGNILYKINWRNMHKSEELFPPNYIV